MMNEQGMHDFFENDLPALMDRLESDMEPLWGIMRPQHMVEHLVWSLRNASGILDFEVKTPADRVPKFVAFLDTNIAIMPDFRNPVLRVGQTEELEFENLDAAKAAFWELWEQYQSFYRNNPQATTTNPVYGVIGYREWNRLHFKHFIHHLAQFGLLKVEDYGLKPFVR